MADENLSKIQQFSQLQGAADGDPAGGYMRGELLDYLWRLLYGKYTKGGRTDAATEAYETMDERNEKTRAELREHFTKNPNFSPEYTQQLIDSQLPDFTYDESDIEGAVKGGWDARKPAGDLKSPGSYVPEDFNPEEVLKKVLMEDFERQNKFFDQDEHATRGMVRDVGKDVIGGHVDYGVQTGIEGERQGNRLELEDRKHKYGMDRDTHKAGLRKFELNPNLMERGPEGAPIRVEKDYTGDYGGFSEGVFGKEADPLGEVDSPMPKPQARPNPLMDSRNAIEVLKPFLELLQGGGYRGQ